MQQPVVYLRIEGLAMLLCAFSLYLFRDFSLVWFAVMLLAVDASMIGYLVNQKIGAHVYNVGHSLTLPLLLLGAALLMSLGWLEAIAYIWIAHIGMDRMLGFGLKYSSGFKDTILGRIGKS